MRQRMLKLRATQVPDKRRQVLKAQMKDMETLLDEGICPKMGGGMMAGRGRPGMMGQGMMGRGMQYPGLGGMDGGGMRRGMGGHGPAAPHAATFSRLDTLEKRVELIQLTLQMLAC